MFYFFLPPPIDKKFSPLLLKFFYHTSHALFVMQKNKTYLPAKLIII